MGITTNKMIIPVWFVVVPNKQLEKVFKGRKAEWLHFLKQNNIPNPELFPVWQVFEKLKNDSILPW